MQILLSLVNVAQNFYATVKINNTVFRTWFLLFYCGTTRVIKYPESLEFPLSRPSSWD